MVSATVSKNEHGGTYTVYMHKLFDGRVYIGITSKTTKRRWQNGHGYSKHTYFYNAIQKYGWDAFEHIILFQGLTKEEAEKEEVRLIKEYQSTDHSKGFNIANGGSSAVPLSDETKQKLREKATGKRASEETRRKMSETRRGKKQSPEHIKKRAAKRVGKHLSEETKAKISKAHLGIGKGTPLREETKRKISENNGKKRKVVQLSNSGEILSIFNSMSEAGRAVGVSCQEIWHVANHRQSRAGGYRWEYVEKVTA